MRQRRDPFARITLVPVAATRTDCTWCGTTPKPRRPLHNIERQSDGGRVNTLRGTFCSWSCADAYHYGLEGN